MNIFKKTYSLFYTFWARREVLKKILGDDDKGLKEKTFSVLGLFNKANLLMKSRLGFCFPFTIGIPKNALLDPVRLEYVQVLERLDGRFEYVRTEGETKLNFFIPTIDPELIFGGYIALFNFLKSVIERGFKVRIILFDNLQKPLSHILPHFPEGSVVRYCLENSEIIDPLSEGGVIEVSPDDYFAGYSWATMREASNASRSVNGKTPVFFIQEYESIFYGYDSFRFLCDETYGLEHCAIFNSPQLVDFFKANKLGVFSGEGDGAGKWLSFKQSIADVRQPMIDEISSRKTKKVLFYARPEGHADRNLFEIGMIALKRACMAGVFDEDWEFYGIGSLGTNKELSLGGEDENESRVKLLPRVSFDEYRNLLSDFDLGVSLMYSPHPSVPPLEMAKAGMVTVTTEFVSRTAEVMQGISANIIAAECSIDGIVRSLQEAVGRVGDYDERIRNADFDWPTCWEDVFDAAFVDKVITMVDSNHAE